jgi:transmembrane sensor
MTDPRLEYLLEKHLAKTCSEMEKKELAGMILATGNEAGIQAFLEKTWDTMKTDENLSAQKADQLFNSILQQGGKKDTGIVRKMFNWKKIAVAASVLIAIAAVGYFVIPGSDNHTELVSESSKDVKPPQSTKAIITLADGRTIALDSLTMVTQGNVSVVKNSKGEIIYESNSDESQSTNSYNTLSNPRGSQIATMTLADGTKVWLNTGSSITYPIAFTGHERKVSIIGEAYFEVAHDKTKPFIVGKGETQVEVLGTQFNVNAYDDENEIKVTLLEGSVMLRQAQHDKEVILKPGQQAQVNASGQISIDKNANVEVVIAWKNGKFVFENADIKSIMRQLERWYDVEVSFENNITDEQFVGIISRDVKISNVLTMFEKSGVVKFEIDGKKVHVK